MKRFLLFSGYLYYPSGGWEDFDNSFDTLDEAKAAWELADHVYKWCHIVDTKTWKIVTEC